MNVGYTECCELHSVDVCVYFFSFGPAVMSVCVPVGIAEGLGLVRRIALTVER